MRNEMMSLVHDLWQNDRVSYFKIVEILDLLSKSDVDLR